MASEAHWIPYEDELRHVFGFYPDVDPDPSEWFPTEDFARFTPYLEALKEEARAKSLVDESHAPRTARGMDRTTHDLDDEHDQAAEALRHAEAELKRLDRDPELGAIRSRAEIKLLELRGS